MSQLNLRVERGELTAGILDSHVPIYASLSGLDIGCIGCPSGCRLAEGCNLTKACIVDALAGERTQFIFSNVEPTAMLWGV